MERNTSKTCSLVAPFSSGEEGKVKEAAPSMVRTIPCNKQLSEVTYRVQDL